MAKPKTNKDYKSPKTFLIKDAESFFIAKVDFFDEIENRQDALVFGIEHYIELQKTLIADSKEEFDLFIGNMKVSNGLKRTLEELDYRYPNLINEILSVGRRLNGQRIGIC